MGPGNGVRALSGDRFRGRRFCGHSISTFMCRLQSPATVRIVRGGRSIAKRPAQTASTASVLPKR